jgi:Zn-dependent peptidase ImmA (M78 family)
MTRAFPEIERLAASIADLCCPALPVDPERIAKEEGITWSYEDYGETFVGLLAHRPSGFHIFCNTKKGSTRGSARGRFTFAHELGHYFIDAHRRAIVAQQLRHYSTGEWKSDNLIESQADTFAAALLMPASRIAKTAFGMPAVFSVADKFDVSRTSAAIRCVRTAALPCAMVLWRKDGPPWSWISDAAHAARMHKTISALPLGADDYATSKAQRGDAAPAQGFFAGVTTASAWFPYVPAGSPSDRMMREHAVKLGEHGTLTLVFEDPTLRV